MLPPLMITAGRRRRRRRGSTTGPSASSRPSWQLFVSRRHRGLDNVSVILSFVSLRHRGLTTLALATRSSARDMQAQLFRSFILGGISFFACRLLLKSTCLVPGPDELGPPHCPLLRYKTSQKYMGDVRSRSELTAIPFRANTDKELVLALVKNCGCALEFASDALRGDEEVCEAAVSQHWLSLMYCTAGVKRNKRVVLAAVRNGGNALHHAHWSLQGDPEVALVACRQNGLAIRFVSKELKADRSVAIAAVTQNGRVLEYVDKELRGDAEVVAAAVGQCAIAFISASAELRAHYGRDSAVVTAAVSEAGRCLRHASDELKNAEETVLAAVRQSGMCLMFASPLMRDNAEVVAAAVGRNGLSLQWASERCRADKGLVLAAVAQTGASLRYAGDHLKDDREVVTVAITASGAREKGVLASYMGRRPRPMVPWGDEDEEVLKHASEELQQDPHLKRLAREQAKRDLETQDANNLLSQRFASVV